MSARPIAPAMPLIDYVTAADADAATGELLGTWEATYDKPSLLRQVLANNPAMLAAWTDYFHRVMEAGALSVRLKEHARVAVSLANECAYCASSHAENLVEIHGLGRDRVAAIANDAHDDLSAREAAVVRFATQVARDPKRVSAAHLEALRAAGFDDADVIELLLVTTNGIAANAITDAMDVSPADRDDVLSTYLPE